MRDAFGGLTSIVIIVVFLVIVSGYLAFNVTYTKAFKVKNKVISVLEQYEGICNLNDEAPNTCGGEIKSYMDSVGYQVPSFTIDDYTCSNING